MQETPTRDIVLERTFNVRDLGGYPGADGRTVRWRTMFRGAGLHRLSGDDVGRVARLGVRTVVDLRTNGELEQRGGYPVDVLPATVWHLPLIARIWDQVDLVEAAAAEEYLFRRYREMFYEGRPVVARVLRILTAAESYPVAFYCAAGKDRTGVLAAIVLGLIGVPDEHIVADYHLSAERVQRIVERAHARRRPEATMVEQPPQLLMAPPRAMQLVLDWTRERFGSIEGYAAELGVGPREVAGIRDNLLEPAGPSQRNDR